jgi:hypothetical protein
MADSPCTCCGIGFHGKAFIGYVNYYDDRVLVQKRLRLCIDCIADHFLILVEKADSRDERGNWIDYRESESWGEDAPLVNTVAAARVALSLRQPAEHTSTSPTQDGARETFSAQNATAPSTLPRSQSSKPSETQGSTAQDSQTSNARSKNGSPSASRANSSRATRETKPTGT